MKLFFSSPISLLIFFLFFPLTQTTPAQNTGKKSGVEFTCVPWKKIPYPQLYYRDGKQFLPLELFTGKRSEVYSLKTERTLELFILKTNDAGKNVHELVGKAPFLKSTKQMLFFIGENKQDAESPLLLYGIDDSQSAFPPGTFRFINFTKVPLQMTLGSNSSTVKPSGITLVKSGVSSKGGLIPFYLKTSRGETVYENRLFAQPDFREIVIIMPPTDGQKKLSIKFLSQIVPPQKTR